MTAFIIYSIVAAFVLCRNANTWRQTVREWCIKLVEFEEPHANSVWPLVFIALDYHAVNMRLEWILTARTQHWKVKVSDNGCTGYWGGRRELLAVLDHFYVGIFLRTAGLRCISKRKTVHDGNRRVDGAAQHYFRGKVVCKCNRFICLSLGKFDNSPNCVTK